MSISFRAADSPVVVSRRHDEAPAILEKPLASLVRELNRAFDLNIEDPEEQGEKVNGILEQYVSTQTDWKEYANFCPLKYSRNLVARTEKYELMVICWDANQVSPIHNHEGQRCWMGVLDGSLEETYFRFTDTLSSKGTGPLEKTQSRFIEQGKVGYITDDIALHVIRPVVGTACSMHLYSLPIPECNVYCPKTGIVTRRRLGFYTEFKKLLPCCSTSAGSCRPSQAPSY